MTVTSYSNEIFSYRLGNREMVIGRHLGRRPLPAVRDLTRTNPTILSGCVLFLLLARRGALPARCSLYMSFLWGDTSAGFCIYMYIFDVYPSPRLFDSGSDLCESRYSTVPVLHKVDFN
jgi:hypothetical protein